MSTPYAPRITYEASDLLLGVWRNLLVGVWRAKPTLESAIALREQYLTAAREIEGGFVIFGVIEAGAPSPDPPARRAIVAAIDAVAEHVIAAAIVLEATGVAAAAARAALATMSMLTRARTPRRFFGSVTDAAEWTERILQGSCDAEEIARVMTELRAPR